MVETKLHFNGIDAATGKPLIEPLEPAALVASINSVHQATPADDRTATLTALDGRKRADGTLGVIAGVDPFSIEQARWGIVYPPGTPPDVREALAPLVAARDGRVLDYPSGQDARSFRSAHGQPPGAVNPDALPYYLLLIGPPTAIDFDVQRELGHQHAVGRLDFEDAADYASYVERLLSYEKGDSPFARERLLTVFAPAHQDDEASDLSSQYLALPLNTHFSNTDLPLGQNTVARYRCDLLSADAATRSALKQLLTAQAHRPAVVFTAGHGLAYSSGAASQRDQQGAIVCQEWAGSNHPVADADCFAAKDIPDTTRLDGLVFFSFACFGAGTPRVDTFRRPGVVAADLAPAAFTSRLPQKLLSQGALAFIGHVDRALDFSFLWENVGTDIGAFRSTLHEILTGKPVGHALDYFHARCLELSGWLSDDLEKLNNGHVVDPAEIAYLSLARNDACRYTVFGDPFAQLRSETLTEPD